ncbi:hypothetical protein COBT_002495, partial [Conglomerata obtusa]
MKKYLKNFKKNTFYFITLFCTYPLLLSGIIYTEIITDSSIQHNKLLLIILICLLVVQAISYYFDDVWYKKYVFSSLSIGILLVSLYIFYNRVKVYIFVHCDSVDDLKLNNDKVYCFINDKRLDCDFNEVNVASIDKKIINNLLKQCYKEYKNNKVAKFLITVSSKEFIDVVKMINTLRFSHYFNSAFFLFVCDGIESYIE